MSLRGKGSPVGLTRMALFITHPPAAGADVAESHYTTLILTHLTKEEIPVIDLLSAVRALAAGTVKPDLEQRSVRRNHAFKGLCIGIVIAVSTIVRMVPVPGGKVDTKADAGLFAGCGKLCQHVPFAITPAAVGN